jgi:DNA-binding response OmpR family regulator/signal transduction histidine kinase
MIAQPIEVLLVSTPSSNLVNSLNPEAYHIELITDSGEAMQRLHDAHYDVVLLDDAQVGDDTLRMIREIRRRFPLTPLLALSQKQDGAYHNDLMDAGATDLLTGDQHRDELQRRVRLVLQQRRQAQALAHRNNNLQALTTLSRQLHTAINSRALIVEAISLTCRTFDLYGMAIVLHQGEMLHVYAGQESVTEHSVFESTYTPNIYDPFRRAIDTGFVQTFNNIREDDFFTPIPVLPEVESAILVPLASPDFAYGTLAAFGKLNQPLNQDDLIIFELFAAQFTTALQNAQHAEEQDRRVQTSSHLLRAWQRFITLDSSQEIAVTLREMVEEIPSVKQALVWLYESDQSGNVVVDAAQEEVAQIFKELHAKESFDRYFDEKLQVILQPGRGQKDPLGPLYRGLKGQHLMLFAVTDSARVTGGVIASCVGNAQFGLEDANLMNSLAHAAGQSLVRTMLTGIMSEKRGSLESILRSIYEGIFFIDTSGLVTFCNTQFAELTSINPGEVLYRDPNILLDQLAANTHDPETTRQQLQNAVENLRNDNDQEENYTVLPLTLTNPERAINLEIARIISDTGDNAYLGWYGIIRDNSQAKHMFGGEIPLLDMMSEQIRVPYAELRGLTSSLLESHSRFSNRDRAHFLRQMEKNIEHLGQLWDNFLDMYNLEVSGLALEREESDIYDLVQHVLESRLFHEHRRFIRLEAPARLPLVHIDEPRIERVVSNVLQHAISVSPRGAGITLTLESTENEVLIIVQNTGAGYTEDELAYLFDPTQANDELGNAQIRLGLHLSQKLVERHNGRIWIESQAGNGSKVTVALPTAHSTGFVNAPTLPDFVRTPSAPAAAVAHVTQAAEEPRSTGYSVQKRQPKTIMIVEGKSSLVQLVHRNLENQGYEIIFYESGEDALRDVNAVRLDLIVLDVNLPDSNSLDICERMRKQTQVPIIMLADEASEAEEIRALKFAEAFISRPISENQLMARVDVILKLVSDLPTRTREPLDLGNLYIDFARREVYLFNKPIELTRIEYDLLYTLATHENHVLTHKQLLDKVWGPEYQAETQYLWVNVSRLRKKLEPTPDSPRYIQTQQGVGYVFRRP